MSSDRAPDSTPSSSDDVLVDVRGVEVAYPGGIRALAGLDLKLAHGCHGLLGPNGAGKSTLIKVLLGLIRPTAGTGRVLDRDLLTETQLLRQRVGYMPERDAHLPTVTAIDYVALFGEISGLTRSLAMKRAHEVLHYVELGEARYRSVDGYSAGMRQRLKLAAAIVHDPALVFLDEPTNGLDPDGRRDMLDLVTELASSGTSILLSTHLLPDVQEVCENVVVIGAGNVRRTGTVKELTRGLANIYSVRFQGDSEAFLEALEARGLEARYDRTRGSLSVSVPEGAGTEPILAAALASDVGLKHLTPGARSLEDVFLESLEETNVAHS